MHRHCETLVEPASLVMLLVGQLVHEDAPALELYELAGQIWQGWPEVL